MNKNKVEDHKDMSTKEALIEKAEDQYDRERQDMQLSNMQEDKEEQWNPEESNYGTIRYTGTGKDLGITEGINTGTECIQVEERQEGKEYSINGLMRKESGIYG